MLDADEYLIAQREMKDGWISGQIDFPANGKKEAGFILRYQGEEKGCIAGVGGWDSMFCIAAMIRRGEWEVLESAGSNRDITGRRSFNLQVQVNGSEIILFENGVEQLRASQKRYKSGRIGLYADSPGVKFSNIQVVQKKCFVVMPFSRKFNYIYRDIKEAVEAKDLVCIRSDENRESSPIMTEVVEQIRASDLVIVDLTDQNPNVYYEAGLAHAFRKKCIVLAKTETDVKFDLQHIRAFFYGRHRKRLKSELLKWIDESQTGGNSRR
jgi:hypothetical protein